MTRLAVLGDPLRFTRSPDLHRAGCAALGIACESVALRTSPSELPARLDQLVAEGYRGVNLTHPLKDAALAHVARPSAAALAARSVNTISLPERSAESTDGPGFLDLLVELGRDPCHERIVLLGAGGAARSLAWSLANAGAAAPVVSARDPFRAASSWAGLAAEWVGWRSADEATALRSAGVVVNCTPLAGDDAPAPVELLATGALVLDLVYGEELTPWVVHSRAAGRAAFDGLGLLVHQARRSLAFWLGRDVPIEPLARAVGWPR